jgi:hypothetical protein
MNKKRIHGFKVRTIVCKEKKIISMSIFGNPMQQKAPGF